MPDPPSGIVAFLFTDIAGSTRLWQAYPDAMHRAYERHDAVLRGAIAAQRGVAYKVIGDAWQVAFITAPEAVAAALQAQRELAAEDWGVCELPEPLRIRMALHVGDVEPGPDGDYRSPVLNRLGRLLAVGHGGQILLSQAAFELARDALPGGIAVRDLGERRLKDLYRPERVYQLLHPALPSEFPPLATLDRRPHNLPIQPTPLIGREAEVAAIRGLLTQRESRLVTLTGPGGIGKTRLGLQVAAELVDIFNHGAYFLPLGAITDAGLVLSATAQALGVQEESGRTLLEGVQEHLRERELLLLLDNFEQVLAAARIVAGLLAAAPGLTVLATSRERLGLRGEREVAVPPLAFPVTGRTLTLESLTQYEAVRLFIARAQDARPDFQVTNETAPAVAEICARLDGLPLAIELAAARIRLLPPAALLERLERRLAVLTGGARDLPERQQTLRGAIDWSYDLLDPEEQFLFRRLGVFVGGFSLEAAEAITPSPSSALDLIGSLVDKSLVRQGAEIDGEPRFTMLETIREYALERLDASGEAGDVRRRHAEALLLLAEEADDVLVGSKQLEWLHRLSIEHDNFRAALRWALQPGGDAGLALRLANGIAGFWFVRGHLAEGRGWLDQALAAAPDASPKVRSEALENAASLAWGQGDYARAEELYQQVLTLERDRDDAVGAATALANLGLVAQGLGNYERARAHLEEAIAALREQGDPALVARALLNLGSVHYYLDDLPQAAATYEESLGLARQAGITRTAALCLLNLGVIATDQDDDARGEALLSEALGLLREFGDKRAVAGCLASLGGIAHRRGDRAVAAGNLAEALSLCHEIGDKHGLTECFESIASMHPPTRMAARLFATAATLRVTSGQPDRRITDEDRQDEEIAAIRDALGEAEFRAAWDAGRALSQDDAIAEARAALELLAGEPTVG